MEAMCIRLVFERIIDTTLSVMVKLMSDKILSRETVLMCCQSMPDGLIFAKVERNPTPASVPTGFTELLHDCKCKSLSQVAEVIGGS